MQNFPQVEPQPNIKPAARVHRESFGWGVFLLLIGLGMLAERMGWMPANAGWLLPVIFIAWGAGKIYGAFANND